MVSLVLQAGAMLPPALAGSRPVLGHKRDSSYIDTNDEASLSSTTKRLRVAFDPNVDIRVLEDWNEKSYDLVKEEVRTALERNSATGDSRDEVAYSQLVQVFGNQEGFGYGAEAVGSGLLRKYLLALTGRVSQLGGCGKLVMAVLDLPWLGRDSGFVELYRRFLRDLAVAQVRFVPAIFDKLVGMFAKMPASLGRLPSEAIVARSQLDARLHTCVQVLLTKLPSASGAMVRALKDEFPIDLATTKSFLNYITSLLKLAEYAPELRAEVLALIVQRLVAIDVQIQQDLDDLEEEAEDRLLQRPSSKNGDAEAEESDDSDSDSVSSSDETSTEEEMRLRDIRLKIAKMDGMLNTLFAHYDRIFTAGDAFDTSDAFQQLMSHFTAFVLPNRTRHAQFLLFHFTQASPELTTRFVQQCIELAVLQTRTSTHRLAACAYLASFVARGARLSSETVREVFDLLCHYLDGLRHKYEPSCRGPDRRAYSLYYALAQALLYIFCFRWRDLVTGANTSDPETDGMSEDDLVADGRDLGWMPGMKEALSRNIYSRLNPLKVCSATIVGEFAKISNHLRFLYVFPLLETNKRLRLGQNTGYYSSDFVGVGRRETAWDRKTGEAHHQLEAYFPFDPYQLPKSKHWVEGDYNEWKLPPGMKQDDIDDADGDDESGTEYDSDEESLPDVEEEEASAGDHDSISS